MIFSHSNYTAFLHDYIQGLPKNGHGEAKKIAEHLGVSSTFISQVLAGSKTLSLEQGEVLGEYLGLSELESEYFFYLIQLERAGTQRLKKFCKNKIDKLKHQSLALSKRLEPKKSLTEIDKSVFYSSPIFSAIHVFCSTNEKGMTRDEVASRFQLSRSKASEILSFLKNAGLLIENRERFEVGSQSTHLESTSPFLQKHHSGWRLRAIQASEDLDESELMYTVNVSLSKDDFAKLREHMTAFIKTFLKQVHASPAEEIACFNMDFFLIRK
jgi:uncharacterized protein (TIGR02147 family)